MKAAENNCFCGSGALESLSHPLLSYAMMSLVGYTTPELMEQYIRKVEDMGIGFDRNAAQTTARSGFAKGPSRPVSRLFGC